MVDQKVILVTGASTGIGQACALYLHQRGHRVYGTSRQASKTEPVRAESFQMIRMDVNVDESVQRGVEWVVGQEGRLDVVVNNAGFGLAGSIEDTSIEEAKSQLETNFFGALRVCRAALPIMRAQRAGHIINISSLGGQVGLPFQGLYSASKFALEGLTEALRLEVRPYGIQVVLVEPGDCATSFTDRRRKAVQSRDGSVYQERFERTLNVVETDERKGTDPIQIARAIEKIVANPTPRLRYTVGPVYQRVAVALKKIVPAWLFEWGVSKYYKLG